LLGVDDVLKVIAQTLVERVDVDSAIDDSKQSEVLVYRQVGQDVLGQSLHLLLVLSMLRPTSLEEEAIDLVKRWMPAIDQVAQVVN